MRIQGSDQAHAYATSSTLRKSITSCGTMALGITFGGGHRSGFPWWFPRRRGSEIKYAKWPTPHVEARSIVVGFRRRKPAFVFYPFHWLPRNRGKSRPRFLICHARPIYTKSRP